MVEFNKGEIWRARYDNNPNSTRSTPPVLTNGESAYRCDDRGWYIQGPVWDIYDTNVQLQLDEENIYCFWLDFRRNENVTWERVDG